MVKIDFWGIGAQKAGTSWLYRQLVKTPGFGMPPVKEFHYFDRDPRYPSPDKLSKTYCYQRIIDPGYTKNAIKTILSHAGKKDRKTANFYWKWYFSTYTDRWYLSMFKECEGFKGEITPSYSILDIPDIKRMYEISPEAKLIFLLRNPVDRAWSHYRFHTRHIPDDQDGKMGTPDIIGFMESDAQQLRSNYIRTLENFSQVFPKEQILVGFFDAISDDPERLLKEIIRFISGDTVINIDHLNLKAVVNQSRAIDISPYIRDYLENSYYPQISRLAADYGGYFNKWLKETYGEDSRHPDNTLLPAFSLAHAKKHFP